MQEQQQPAKPPVNQPKDQLQVTDVLNAGKCKKQLKHWEDFLNYRRVESVWYMATNGKRNSKMALADAQKKYAAATYEYKRKHKKEFSKDQLEKADVESKFLATLDLFRHYTKDNSKTQRFLSYNSRTSENISAVTLALKSMETYSGTDVRVFLEHLQLEIMSAYKNNPTAQFELRGDLAAAIHIVQQEFKHIGPLINFLTFKNDIVTVREVDLTSRLPRDVLRLILGSYCDRETILNLRKSSKQFNLATTHLFLMLLVFDANLPKMREYVTRLKGQKDIDINEVLSRNLPFHSLTLLTLAVCLGDKPMRDEVINSLPPAKANAQFQVLRNPKLPCHRYLFDTILNHYEHMTNPIQNLTAKEKENYWKDHVYPLFVKLPAWVIHLIIYPDLQYWGAKKINNVSDRFMTGFREYQKAMLFSTSPCKAFTRGESWKAMYTFNANQLVHDRDVFRLLKTQSEVDYAELEKRYPEPTTKAVTHGNA